MSSRIAVLASALALSVVGCGTDGKGASSDGVPTTTTLTATVPAIGRGWIDGKPDWRGTSDEDFGDGAGKLSSDSAAPSEIATAVGGGEDAVPSPTMAGGDVSGGRDLSAGSVDDNASFDDYLDYLARIHSLGIDLRDFDPTGRIVISVVDATGLPVAGADIAVTADGTEIAHVRTTADGTARFHPALYGAAAATEFQFTAEGQSVTAAQNESVSIVVDGPGGTDGPVAVDVLFLLDATGSMGDEIDQLKTSIDSVAAQVEQLQSDPDVRFAMTLYRDLGDQFVTSTFDFTSDVAEFRAALAEVVADGGDDYPEAVDEGLAEALALPSWRDPASTIQLVFLVADAPPQVKRQVATPYPKSIADAIGRGIKIFPVASSESDDQAEAVFRELAQATGSRFVFLTYGAGGAATGGSSDITRTDYEELALDQLVVRLITEELAALTGDTVNVPPPTTSTTIPTTNPEGQ